MLVSVLRLIVLILEVPWSNQRSLVLNYARNVMQGELSPLGLVPKKDPSEFRQCSPVVEIINNQTSKHQGIMVLLRDLVLSCLRHNIFFRARHIPGLANARADYISRSQVAKFKELSPDADELPTTVPENLMPKSWALS